MKKLAIVVVVKLIFLVSVVLNSSVNDIYITIGGEFDICNSNVSNSNFIIFIFN